ncbi:bi-domain-containing oxidoreductase [Allorhodopirellula solitaria]|nr:bi-domain-containing oxidoreductase [Allorhodopirellula solitaria]
MDIAKKSLIGKARERPDQVRRVIEKMKSEGVLDTIRQVREKLDQPMGLGYCSAGVVVSAGQGVDQYKVGDRVACNGPHAGVVSVPVNLCASIAENVSFDQASFAVLGSISMQGVRLAKVSLGETVLVIGLGLVGQVAVGLLAAAGCRVIGTDPDPAKCELALQSGAAIAQPNLSASNVQALSRGAGADAVLITASTSSNGPIELACEAARTKGRIVLVGVVGLEVPRRPMYFKEVEFVVSCSYGPGRYDPNYEERGIDYPIGHVRWTEQRNIQAVLDLMASGKLSVDHLISHRFDIEQAEQAYQMISEGSEPYLGVVLNYAESSQATPRIPLGKSTPVAGALKLGVLGAGNFARMTMFPQLQKAGDFQLTTICSASGMSAHSAGDKFGFSECTADEQEVIRDENTDAVMILTRHHLHSGQVCAALDAGKHVFVEKPLAVDGPQLLAVEDAVNRNPNQIVMVGFNRRFSEAAQQVKQHFAKVMQPLTVQYRFNAGSIPADVWIQHPEEGGGRIIGEACHAIDLVTYLTGSLPVEVYATCIGGPNAPEIVDDQAFITIRHENGSISSIGYLAGGDRAMSKERVEVLGGGKMAVIDDFRRVELASGGKVNTIKTTSGKGHLEEVQAFAQGMRKGRWPIEWSELLSTSWASIAAVQSLREGIPIPLHFARQPNENTAVD